MKLFAACSLAVLLCRSVASTADVRYVDFASHEYPFVHPENWPHKLQWQSPSESQPIRLLEGRWKEPLDEADDANFAAKLPFSGLTLEEVAYGDVTGDHKDDAIVVLRFDTGGTQYHYWVYIFSLKNDQPELLAYFRAGDRASEGLYRTYARNHRLIVEVFDPKYEQGDCCSAQFLRYTFEWAGAAFTQVGALQHGTPKSASRRRVTAFGLPRDQVYERR